MPGAGCSTEKVRGCRKEISDIVGQLNKAQGELAASAKLAAATAACGQLISDESPTDIAAAVSEVQRLECVVQSLSTTSQENLPAVGESLRAIVAALAKVLPQASNLLATQHQPDTTGQTVGAGSRDEVDEEDLDDEVD